MRLVDRRADSAQQQHVNLLDPLDLLVDLLRHLVGEQIVNLANMTDGVLAGRRLEQGFLDIAGGVFVLEAKLFHECADCSNR